jgi:hypothetical protein
MLPTTKLMMERKIFRSCLAALVVVAACGSDGGTPAPDAPSGACVPPKDGTAPTYSELYTKYFAAGTPGHCATSLCHLDSSNGWACGTDKNTCYAGMVSINIIRPASPLLSSIADPKISPLRWFNPNGPMPQDTPGPFTEGRDAIKAWVDACAQNN